MTSEMKHLQTSPLRQCRILFTWCICVLLACMGGFRATAAAQQTAQQQQREAQQREREQEQREQQQQREEQQREREQREQEQREQQQQREEQQREREQGEQEQREQQQQREEQQREQQQQRNEQQQQQQQRQQEQREQEQRHEEQQRTQEQEQQQRAQEQRENQQSEKQQREEQQRAQEQRENQQREEQQRAQEQGGKQQRVQQQREEQQRQEQLLEQQRSTTDPVLRKRSPNPEPFQPEPVGRPERPPAPPNHPDPLPDRLPVRPVGPGRPPVNLPVLPDRTVSVPEHLPVSALSPVRPDLPVRSLRLLPPRQRPVNPLPVMVIPRQTVVVPRGLAQVVVVRAPSTETILALGRGPRVVVAPGATPLVGVAVAPTSQQFAAANAELTAAEATCAQANVYQNYVTSVVNSQNVVGQGTDQILQTLADNTSDPNLQQALTDSIGQPNPINDALQQQLQNMADNYQGVCQTRMAAAQAALSATQSNYTQGPPPSPLTGNIGAHPNPAAGDPSSASAQTASQSNPAQAAPNQQRAAILMAQAQKALKNGETATAGRLMQQAQAYQATAGKGSGFPLKVTWGPAIPVRQMYVAFSFSTPSAWAGSASINPDMDGDGAWGAATNSDEQTAIDMSANQCAATSRQPSTCGTGNGGNYPVCKSDGAPKWVALAISNDGTIDNWSDGEVIGADTQQAAEAGAVANCGKQACQLVWSQSVDCGSGAAGSANGGGSIMSNGNPAAPSGAAPSAASKSGATGTAPPKAHCSSGAVCADPAI